MSADFKQVALTAVDQAVEQALSQIDKKIKHIFVKQVDLKKQEGRDYYQIQLELDGEVKEWLIPSPKQEDHQKQEQQAENTSSALKEKESKQADALDQLADQLLADQPEPNKEKVDQKADSSSLPMRASCADSSEDSVIALKRAIKDAQLELDQVKVKKNKKEMKGSLSYQDITFETEEWVYHYQLHDSTGAILSRKRWPVKKTSSLISRTEALERVLADKGWQRSDIKLNTLELDSSSGQAIYQIEFEQDGRMYHYALSAKQGKIMSPSENLNKRTADQALELACQRAQIELSDVIDLELVDQGDYYRIQFQADDKTYDIMIRSVED